MGPVIHSKTKARLKTLGLVLSVFFFAWLLAALAAKEAGAQTTTPPNVYQDIRYCGPPKRDANGRIARDKKVLSAFAKAHPCPVSGLPVTSCFDPNTRTRWYIDHVIPLASGGCDAVWNLQWLPDHLKTCASTCKDAWERDVYAPR